MKGRSFQDTEYDSYRFGFNGKENDTDFGNKQLVQDYGFRIYNPAIGKFLSVDPLTKDYPMLTPYQFASNTPIAAIDIDGLEGKQIHEVVKGKDGTTQIKKITFELDVYLLIGTSGGWGEWESSFTKSDVEYLNKSLESGSFGLGEVYKDQDTGADVVFKFNVKGLDLFMRKEKIKRKGTTKIMKRPTPLTTAGLIRLRNARSYPVDKLQAFGTMMNPVTFPALVAEQSEVPGTDGGIANQGIKIEKEPDGGQVKGLIHEILHFLLSYKNEGDDHVLKGALGRPYTNPIINQDIINELKKNVPRASQDDVKTESDD